MKELVSFLAIWFTNFKSHVFKVTVTDPGNKKELATLSKDLEKIDSGVKGVISAIGKLEEKDDTSEVKELLGRIVEQVSRKIEFPKIDIPKEVRISNFPEQTEFPKTVEVSNFPAQSEFPKSIEVTNFPKYPDPKEVKFPSLQKVEGAVEVRNQISLEEVIKGLQTVVDVINELRLELPKSFSTGVTSSSVVAAKDIKYEMNDWVSTATVTYLGEETKLGQWQVTKIDTSTGSSSFASVLNNPAVTSYDIAWATKELLSYSNYSQTK